MKELFLPYDLCRSFDMLGFKDKVVAYYNYNNHDELIWAHEPNSNKMLTKAILWQQAIDFLRAKYNINITINTYVTEYGLSYRFTAELTTVTLHQQSDFEFARYLLLRDITEELLKP